MTIQWERGTGKSSKFGGGAYSKGSGPFPHGGADQRVQLGIGGTVDAGLGLPGGLVGMGRRGRVVSTGLRS